MNSQPQATSAFIKLIKNPVKFRLFMLKKLPAAFFSGLRIIYVDTERCEVSVPFKWFTQNPFRSTYFACLSMAAEMSTGVLAMGAINSQSQKVSMLIVGNQGVFHKKATSLTRFSCKDGKAIHKTVELAIHSGLPQTIICQSEGRDEQGNVIASFSFTWSFKASSR
jgi:hypothetical protein